MCPGVPKVSRPNKLLRRTMVRRSTTPSDGTPRSPTLHDATNSQPRCSNNKATLFSVNVAVNFLLTVRCGIKRGEAPRGYSPILFSLREAKQPCPRPSSAVRGGETRVSRALSATPKIY